MSEVSLRIALIGAGYFSQFHRDAWERIDRAQIVAVMDKALSVAEATRYPAF
jgi:predicted dehydrogenase